MAMRYFIGFVIVIALGALRTLGCGDAAAPFGSGGSGGVDICERVECDDGIPCTQNKCDPNHPDICLFPLEAAGASCPGGFCSDTGACLPCDDLDPCTRNDYDQSRGCYFAAEPVGHPCGGDEWQAECNESGICVLCEAYVDECAGLSDDHPTTGCVFNYARAGRECWGGFGVCDGAGTCLRCEADDDNYNDCAVATYDPATGCVFDARMAGEECWDGTQPGVCDGIGNCIACDEHSPFCTAPTYEPGVGCAFRDAPAGAECWEEGLFGFCDGAGSCSTCGEEPPSCAAAAYEPGMGCVFRGEPAGTDCDADDGRGFCDGDGNCVPCEEHSWCIADATYEPAMGCMLVVAAAGEVCWEDEFFGFCDGEGNCIPCKEHSQDCTEATYEPVMGCTLRHEPAGRECLDWAYGPDAMGFCDGAGNCIPCEEHSRFCATSTYEPGVGCARRDEPAGTKCWDWDAFGQPMPGVCDGAGNCIPCASYDPRCVRESNGVPEPGGAEEPDQPGLGCAFVPAPAGIECRTRDDFQTGFCDGRGQCIDCDDGNDCTREIYEPESGCSFIDEPPGSYCDDGDGLCDGAGNCVLCDDDNDCTRATYDPESGCTFVNRPPRSPCWNEEAERGGLCDESGSCVL